MTHLPLENQLAPCLQDRIAERRTFAIISHPDAGKTTLTEKLLLYGNAIELAGSVRARRNQRRATSDWMEIERERGISITSTVLQFPYKGHVINLLDTPGHGDFSEDTYRTLSAADCAVMVLDAAKGIEAQTRKLFEACRRRGLPIFTFVNKMDRPARDPLDLLDEIETVLGMEPAPLNWPVGNGPSFCGVVDRHTGRVHRFDRTAHNQTMAPETVTSLDDPRLADALSDRELAELHTQLAMLDGLGIGFDHRRVLAGEQTPVYFGSALTNFGVRPFLDAFVEHAPSPRACPSDAGPVSPDRPAFSGFVFKIQANMNPNHRDSVAFVRVCSGRFQRDMNVLHVQGGKVVRLARPYKFFANEREVLDEAYPGDILGLPSKGTFAIGDTLCEAGEFRFAPIPRFQPEHFAVLRSTDPSKHKQFLKGLHQLESEGAMQVLCAVGARHRDPILAVVGQLQFDVVRARLSAEYTVSTILEPMPSQLSRWVDGPPDVIERMPWDRGLIRTRDSHDRLVALINSAYTLEYCQEKFPEVVFSSMG